MMAEKIVMCAGCAAFSRGPNGRITAWNDSADRLLARPADFAIDRKCYHVLAGRDQIGNYCSERCPTWRLAKQSQQIKPYKLSVKASQGRRMEVEVTILVSDEDDGLHLIHLLDPVQKADRILLDDGDYDTFDAIYLPYELGQRGLSPDEVVVMHQLSTGIDCAEIAHLLDKPQSTVWQIVSNLVENLRYRGPAA